MARYAPEWMDSVRRPRPLAHIRSPESINRSRQRRDREASRERDRELRRIDRDRDRGGGFVGATDVRLVNDIIDDYPDRPVHVNFNYGHVHIHPDCTCPNPFAHTCATPIPSISSHTNSSTAAGPPSNTSTSRRNTITYPSPYAPAPPPASRRGGPPPSGPPPPPGQSPLPRSILRAPRPPRSPSPGPPPARVSRPPAIIPSPESSDLDERRTRPRPPRRPRGASMSRPPPPSRPVVAVCEGCLRPRELVVAGYCVDCEHLVDEWPRMSTGGGGGGYDPTGRDNVLGASVRRYMRQEERDLAREREIEREIRRERERELDMEWELREREREQREREAMRDAGRRGVRWERVLTVRDGGGDRRYYPGESGGYYSDSGDESAWSR